jgi:hypothetical protein
MNRISLLAAVACLLSLRAAADPTVTVSAGKWDRENAVVTFKLPEGVPPAPAWQLRDGATAVPVQPLPDGRAAFVLPALKAGESKTYRLVPYKAKVANAANAAREGNNVAVSLSDKQVIRYNGDKTPLPEKFEPAFQRGGYIHPVLSPSGKLLSDDYPPAHKHHHGIWMPWTKTEFDGRKPDFWNMGQKSGTVEFASVDGTFSGPVAAGFSAKHRFVDLSAKPQPKVALNETWDVVVYAVASSGGNPVFVYDLTSTQTCATDQPLVLPKYHYGGLGFRGNRQWDGKANATFLTSEGKTRADGNESTATWVHIAGRTDGTVDASTAGLAILNHPENFRAPQPLRIHPTEPFVCYAPQVGGEMKIEPGKPYVSRYRFVAADGPADKGMLDRLYADYATPAEVVVKQ